MTLYKSNEQILSSTAEANFERLANQEETYLEETEEELRTTLIASSSEAANLGAWIAIETHIERAVWRTEQIRLASQHGSALPQPTPKEERIEAAEDLFTGDPDDAPLSEETIRDMLQEPI
jgi:hypothetical protein